MKDGDTPIADFMSNKYRHRALLRIDPLGPVLPSYVEMLLSEGYREHTIKVYLGAVAHFNSWASTKGALIADIDNDFVSSFIDGHLPTCKCNPSLFRSKVVVRAAMSYLVKFLQIKGLIGRTEPATPISDELAKFRRYLTKIRGLTDGTCTHECRWIRRFLEGNFGNTGVST
jgi:integrase/recombinase XerD